MKIEKFDVVELKNGNKATIIDKINEEKFFSEIVDYNGTTIDRCEIDIKDISKKVFPND